MPDALAHKLGVAAQTLEWQFPFPSGVERYNAKLARWVRCHAAPTSLRRAFRDPVSRLDGVAHATIHTPRHAFATHLLQSGTSIRTIQELLDNLVLETTMIYTHVGEALKDVRSPLGLLED